MLLLENCGPITFFVCELVTVGDNCFIGHGVMFINDKLNGSPAKEINPWQSTFISNNVYIVAIQLFSVTIFLM